MEAFPRTSLLDVLIINFNQIFKTLRAASTGASSCVTSLLASHHQGWEGSASQSPSWSSFSLDVFELRLVLLQQQLLSIALRDHFPRLSCATIVIHHHVLFAVLGRLSDSNLAFDVSHSGFQHMGLDWMSKKSFYKFLALLHLDPWVGFLQNMMFTNFNQTLHN